MKPTLIFFALLLSSSILLGQTKVLENPYNPDQRKGKFYLYWGWNLSSYTQSDITFHGDDYNFELQDVVAKDRQSPFSADTYINPANISIPQYNFRIGYYYNDHNSISLGADHMKYVMVQNQQVDINGNIAIPGSPYSQVYNHEPIILTDDFLLFEHTDGLNYLNLEWRRHDNFRSFKLGKKHFFDINTVAGAGAGMMIPRTNTTLLGKERYDAFHLSGWGIDAIVGLDFTFWKFFFLQTELKGGYIDMNKIRTTNSASDGASQHFFFLQGNAVFGFRFGFKEQN